MSICYVSHTFECIFYMIIDSRIVYFVHVEGLKIEYPIKKSRSFTIIALFSQDSFFVFVHYKQKTGFCILVLAFLLPISINR